MMSIGHPAAVEYLRRLERVAQVLPRAERDELLAQIRDHLEAGLSADATESDVRTLLDQLGSPEDVVSAAGDESMTMDTPRGGLFHSGATLEVVALAVLALGFVTTALGWLSPLLGWLPPMGVVLMSRVWSWSDKLIVGVLMPIAAATVIWFTTSAHLRTGEELLIGLVLSLPFAAGYLGWRLRGRLSH